MIGLLSLRLRAIFFSMITLAVAAFAQIVAEQWRNLTGGEDGLTFACLPFCGRSFRLVPDKVMGVVINGPVITYYITFAVSLVLFLIMLRIVNSPFGLVLRAIRENEFRVEAMGYRVVAYRTLVCVISAVMASLAGALMALVLRYNGPDATLSFSLMIDILLMVVIGGMGTIYGAVIGAIVVVLAQYYLKSAMGAMSDVDVRHAGLVGVVSPGPLAVVAGHHLCADRDIPAAGHRRPAAAQAIDHAPDAAATKVQTAAARTAWRFR